MTWWSLLGSGEFQPWSEPVDRRLLEEADGDGRVLILPTASAPEGKDVFERWGSLGLAHFARLEVPAEVLPLKTRDDASRDELIERLEDASVIFFSGGNPARLTQVVLGTPFWDALQGAILDGLPYAGCSAGVACLTELTYDSDTQDLDSVWAPGINYVRNALFAPHWDIVDSWIPGATEFISGSVKAGQTFIALDEETAMVGDGRSWRVMGSAKIHVLRDGEWTRYADGDAFELPLEIAGERA